MAGRALIYARLSSSNDNSTSIERQLKACRDLAESRGWTVVGEHIDDGVSGVVAPAERPAMAELLAEMPYVDAVIAWKVDRISRSLLDFAQLLKQGDQAGTAIVSCTETIDTSTAMGTAFAQLIAMFAELERGMMTERLANARRHLRSTTRHVSGRPPYGLKIVPAPDGKGKVLIRDLEAVAVIREIVRRLRAGELRSVIAEDLAARGVRSPREQTAIKANPKPARWSGEGIAGIVRHPSMLGHRVDEHGHVRRDAEGQEIEFWEPADDPQHIAEARAALDSRSYTSAPNTTHWLSAAAICGTCGRGLTYANNKPYPTSPNAEPIMRCYGRAGDRCKGTRITVTKLEEFVTNEFLSVAGHLEAVESVFVPGTDNAAELESTTRAIANLRDDRDLGLFDDDEDDYRARMKALVARRARLQAEPSRPASWTTRGTGSTVAEVWERSGTDGRAALIRSMGQVCVVYSAQRRRNVATEDRAEFMPTEVAERIYPDHFAA
ncbi:recombinase family protein [Nocardiopsis sp. NPDC055879]